jgi:hypothetical protein
MILCKRQQRNNGAKWPHAVCLFCAKKISELGKTTECIICKEGPRKSAAKRARVAAAVVMPEIKVQGCELCGSEQPSAGLWINEKCGHIGCLVCFANVSLPGLCPVKGCTETTSVINRIKNAW